MRVNRNRQKQQRQRYRANTEAKFKHYDRERRGRIELLQSWIADMFKCSQINTPEGNDLWLQSTELQAFCHYVFGVKRINNPTISLNEYLSDLCLSGVGVMKASHSLDRTTYLIGTKPRLGSALYWFVSVHKCRWGYLDVSKSLDYFVRVGDAMLARERGSVLLYGPSRIFSTF